MTKQVTCRIPSYIMRCVFFAVSFPFWEDEKGGISALFGHFYLYIHDSQIKKYAIKLIRPLAFY